MLSKYIFTGVGPWVLHMHCRVLGFYENMALSLPGFHVTVSEAQSLLLKMPWPQFCEQEILLKCCQSLNHLEQTLVGKAVNCDSSPTRMWKHHKPHCATINNTTLSHYSEFHWGVLDGNNEVCVRDCSSALHAVVVRPCTWTNVRKCWLFSICLRVNSILFSSSQQ